MKKRILFGGLLACALAYGDLLYTDTYMSRSGIVAPRIDTGIPNRVNGSTLLHWNRYIVRLTPVVFRGERIDDRSSYTLEQLEELIRQNRSKIRYISLIGHSSAVVGDEDRIDLDGWSGLWQSLGGDPRIDRQKAITLVNERLRTLYDRVRDAGMPASRIYTENRLDKEPLYTEATASGRLANNRVDVAIYSTGPLHLNDLRILFALDSDRILPGNDERIARFAEILKHNPDLRTTIVGHTDRRGGYAYNMDLSKRRAEAVKRRLVEIGISPERIRTEGRGYTQPVARGHNEAAYRQNRRIEARLYR